MPTRRVVIFHAIVALVLPNIAWLLIDGAFGIVGLIWSGWYLIALVGWIFIHHWIQWTAAKIALPKIVKTVFQFLAFMGWIWLSLVICYSIVIGIIDAR